nr:uncharacterized protein LOC109418475 [Aedes albopictus]
MKFLLLQPFYLIFLIKDSIQLVDGVTLVKQNASDDAENETTPDLSDARALEGLSSIDRSLIQKLDKFLKTHTVKMDLATEGRGRGDKKHGSRYIIAAMLTAIGIAGPIGLKTLGAIAFKALVISKVALTIASILALKKIFKSDHHEETSFQVHAGHDNRRNTNVRPARIPNDPYRYYYEQPVY